MLIQERPSSSFPSIQVLLCVFSWWCLYNDAMADGFGLHTGVCANHKFVFRLRYAHTALTSKCTALHNTEQKKSAFRWNSNSFKLPDHKRPRETFIANSQDLLFIVWTLCFIPCHKSRTHYITSEGGKAEWNYIRRRRDCYMLVFLVQISLL